MYFSPEEVSDIPVCTQASDVWSLGMVFREMLTGYQPFEGEHAILIRNITNLKFAHDLDGTIRDDIVNLIEGMEERDQGDRKTCNQLLELPLFDEVRDSVLERHNDVCTLKDWWEKQQGHSFIKLVHNGLQLCSLLLK